MFKGKSKYGFFIVTFIGALIIFSMYVFKFINSNEQINEQITILTKNIDLKSESLNLFIIIICAVTLFFLFILNYIINKVIFKAISINVDSMKLATSILISYNFVFILANLLVTYMDIKLLFLTIILNLIEIGLMVTLLSEELGRNKYKYCAIRLVLLIINAAIMVLVY